MNRMVILTSVMAALGSAGALPAQSPAPPQPPPAKPADVRSVDAVIAALYDVISGPAGQQRDWDRFRSLFAPGARLIPTSRDSAGKSRIAAMLSADDYAGRIGPRLEETGFFESEIGRAQDQYGNVVHAFSAYDSKRTAADKAPFARGINSIQLLNDGTRWWIVSIFWEGETPQNPIPAKYLNKLKQ
jgi:hypothetical protein